MQRRRGCRAMDDSRVGSWRVALSSPGVDTVWGAVAVIVPIVAVWFGRTQAVDLAYQVRAGIQMLDAHHLLTTDPFTFSVAGHSWLNQQWGAELFFGAAWRVGGWDGLAVVWGLMVGAIALFLFLAC